ncbi:hypothetical protein FA09DRAFT_357665 [Tilletiopsis washingtonensis]|uniref:Mediator of RNA polymerase II transcription subunit 19 n=1 Tax=Tilletiopsis washingtonensis TaxID=58919 RepID=A0A316ZID0_9BASI|nr:hypothetical protein FA09DRAFT_357665 [Tilletiopsis washingtonensis]PWO01047.1 hypothetical protein FA09DRAFT_357665 [Tilletiopsis washingtonensis]
MDGSTASSSSALYVPAPLPPAEVLPSVALNGAADLLPRFGLLPLYERAVRPYLPRRRAPPGADGASAQQAHADDAAGDETLPLDGDERRADGEPPVRLLPKTYAHYVEDLPGKVRPPKSKRTQRAPPTGTTMRDIVFRPETTLQRIVPFDDEALRAAFAVRAGDVPEIDASLLEADAEDAGNRRRKKPKRKRGDMGNTSIDGPRKGGPGPGGARR